MTNSVEISFNCLPLRSIGRLDIPLDASPGYIAQLQRIRDAIEKHGSHNAYYLYRARCVYRLANHPLKGMLEFSFEGTALTDAEDCHTEQCDLQVELVQETCDWITEPVLEWFKASVPRAVTFEFDRYIAAGDLEQTRKRVEKLRAESDASGGFLGMYL
jgi:hypothetical protein